MYIMLVQDANETFVFQSLVDCYWVVGCVEKQVQALLKTKQGTCM